MKTKNDNPRNDVRQSAATSTAIIVLFVGLGLTIAGFIVEPTGQIHDTVLWVLGQTLIYAASVFGVAQYFNSRLRGFENEARKYIDELDRKRADVMVSWEEDGNEGTEKTRAEQ